MKQRLLDALKHANADYAEIRFEENDGTNFAYRGKELESAATARNTGGIVRACKNGGWATSVFDSLDNLEQKIADACADAALIGKEKTQLAEVEAVGDVVAPGGAGSWSEVGAGGDISDHVADRHVDAVLDDSTLHDAQ